MDGQTYQDLMSDLQHLKSSNWRALGVTLAVGLGTFMALGLSLSPHPAIWLVGQVLLGVSLLQWFVLLHDCGHRHFFASVWLNDVVGHVAGLFCMVPFFPWKLIHRDHHLWVGWGDLDPTLRATRPQRLPTARRWIIDVCWQLWIPLFTLSFGLLNFWNLPRLWRMHPRPLHRAQHTFSVVFAIACYCLLVWWLGDRFLRLFGLGFLVYLVISDPLLLSQHSHMEQQVSEGAKVAPFKVWEQDRFTRSIVCPPWMSSYLLLNFDAHGVHHLMPNLPCYHLGTAHRAAKVRNRIDWWQWLKAAKRIPAHQLLFQHRGLTGFEL